MLATFLMVIAFAGGAAIVYALMDAPRREARKQLRDLAEDRRELRDERDDLDDRTRVLDTRTRALAEAVRNYDRRAADLDARTAAFEKRAIQYDDLVAENRLIKTDLRNMTLRVARHEYDQRDSTHSLSKLAASRDRLGMAYLGEVRAGLRKTLTPGTYATAKQRLREAVERVLAEQAVIPPDYERDATQELHAQYEKLVRAAVEREQQVRIRESMREKMRREHEEQEARRRAEQEQRAIERALEQALADASGQHAAEIEQLQVQLAEAVAKTQRTISNAEKGIKEGHVYVISNIGSFGPNIFKIGMTRRSDPQERVAELGSASVPFPFDVHAMIKTDDAPRLETALHRAFHRKRVNRANPRKEFFRVTMEEIVEVVRTHHGEVEYEADAEALEYLSSQKMTDADLAEVEEVFARAEEEAGANRLAGLIDED